MCYKGRDRQVMKKKNLLPKKNGVRAAGGRLEEGGKRENTGRVGAPGLFRWGKSGGGGGSEGGSTGKKGEKRKRGDDPGRNLPFGLSRRGDNKEIRRGQEKNRQAGSGASVGTSLP